MNLKVVHGETPAEFLGDLPQLNHSKLLTAARADGNARMTSTPPPVMAAIGSQASSRTCFICFIIDSSFVTAGLRLFGLNRLFLRFAEEFFQRLQGL